MGKKSIRIDLEDADGAKFNIKLEGNVTREKVLKVFELMDLVDIEKEIPSHDTLNSKIWHLVDKFYPVGRFTSNDILEKYEDEFNEPVKLSVISTYLSRFSSKQRIVRAKTGREWTYQMAATIHDSGRA